MQKKLLVLFHGAITDKIKLPVHRLACENEDVDTLSISDKMLEIFEEKKLLLSWYLGTKTNTLNEIYYEIIDNIIKRKNYDKIIFTGSSGGSYPALLFASLFNQYCVINNGQIYLEKYQYFKHMKNIIGNDIVYNNIENIITNDIAPKHIYIYQNINDTHHYMDHTLPFVDMLNSINYKSFTLNLFDIKSTKKKEHEYFDGATHHQIYTPHGKNLTDVIKEILTN